VHLPRLAARGYPAPSIVWHGRIDDHWYAVVEERLPGAPLTSLSPRQLSALLELAELQAEAGIEPGSRDFAGYVSNVLFDGWDGVWRDAESAAQLCGRLRRWLRPCWGLRLSGGDFAHNDLNLSNVLGDGTVITGVVDWDEFGVNSRAADLIALAFDCIRLEKDQAAVPSDAAQTLLGRARTIAGDDEVRCLVGYRVIAHLAALVRRGEHGRLDESVAVAERILELAG
jgi:aminoglycoside phosphotransferase (APT) family kinase protein